MKKLPVFALCALCTLLLFGCGQQPTEQSPAPSSAENNEPQVVKIGVIAPLSGPAASIGKDAVSTFTFATQQFNNSQKKYTIELIIEDGKCEGKASTDAAQKLVNIDNVKIILGGVCSSETLAAAKITAPAGVVLVSAGSSSPEVSKETNYVYRYYNDLNQAATLKTYFDTNNISRIALMYENNDYGIGYANALQSMLGNTNIIVSEKFSGDEKDFSLITKKVKAEENNIDAIVFIPSSDNSSINIIKSLNNEELLSRFKGKVFTSEVGYSEAVVKQVGPLIEGILTTQLPNVSDLGSEATSFIEAFKKEYEISFAEVFIILYKESFDMVTTGILDEAYGPTKLNVYIKSITETNKRNGLFGSYYFKGADVERLSFIIKQVQNGKLVTTK